MALQNTSQKSDAQAELRLNAGLWLKGLRENAGLSQRELADRIGLPYYTFISQIESGKGRIPSERYAAWAEALGHETKAFATKMLSFYEPHTYEMIFGAEAS